MRNAADGSIMQNEKAEATIGSRRSGINREQQSVRISHTKHRSTALMTVWSRWRDDDGDIVTKQSVYRIVVPGSISSYVASEKRSIMQAYRVRSLR